VRAGPGQERSCPGALAADVLSGAPRRDRLAHDNRPRPLKLCRQALGDDLRSDFGRLTSGQTRAARQRQRKADFNVAGAGGRELVIHGRTTIAPARTNDARTRKSPACRARGKYCARGRKRTCLLLGECSQERRDGRHIPRTKERPDPITAAYDSGGADRGTIGSQVEMIWTLPRTVSLSISE
jgi:hypothetical protein